MGACNRETRDATEFRKRMGTLGLDASSMALVDLFDTKSSEQHTEMLHRIMSNICNDDLLGRYMDLLRGDVSWSEQTFVLDTDDGHDIDDKLAIVLLLKACFRLGVPCEQVFILTSAGGPGYDETTGASDAVAWRAAGVLELIFMMKTDDRAMSGYLDGIRVFSGIEGSKITSQNWHADYKFAPFRRGQYAAGGQPCVYTQKAAILHRRKNGNNDAFDAFRTFDDFVAIMFGNSHESVVLRNTYVTFIGIGSATNLDELLRVRGDRAVPIDCIVMMGGAPPAAKPVSTNVRLDPMGWARVNDAMQTDSFRMRHGPQCFYVSSMSTGLFWCMNNNEGLIINRHANASSPAQAHHLHHPHVQEAFAPVVEFLVGNLDPVSGSRWRFRDFAPTHVHDPIHTSMMNVIFRNNINDKERHALESWRFSSMMHDPITVVYALMIAGNRGPRPDCKATPTQGTSDGGALGMLRDIFLPMYPVRLAFETKDLELAGRINEWRVPRRFLDCLESKSEHPATSSLGFKVALNQREHMYQHARNAHIVASDDAFDTNVQSSMTMVGGSRGAMEVLSFFMACILRPAVKNVFLSSDSGTNKGRYRGDEKPSNTTRSSSQ